MSHEAVSLGVNGVVTEAWVEGEWVRRTMEDE